MPEPKRQVSAKEVVTDLRAGKTDLELMRKYELSPKGLESLLNKLVQKGIVAPAELDSRKSRVTSAPEARPAEPRTRPQAPQPTSSFKCPSCGLPQAGDSEECPRCGLVLRKQQESPMRDQPPLGPAPGVVTRAPMGHMRPPMGASARGEASSVDSAMIVGVVGSVLLLLGCFSPVIRVGPLVGVNLFSIGQFSQLAQALGFVLVGIAVTGLVLCVTRRYGTLLACGGGAIAVLLIALVVFHRKIAESKAAMNAAMSKLQTQAQGPQAEAIQQFSAKMMSQMVQIGLGWGWLPLFAGAFLLLVAFFLAPKESDF
ncbi:MAG: hypothetical protein AB1646_01450 [Thermodesulfobacteriota bacterium]